VPIFVKAFWFINFVSMKRGKLTKTADISTICPGFLGSVEAGVKGKTFYQLCKHSTSCLLSRMEVPPSAIHLIVE